MPVLRDLFLRPGEFFYQLASSPADFRFPVLIILVTGILSAISTYLIMSFFSAAFVADYLGSGQAAAAPPGLVEGIFGAIVVIASAVAVLGPFVTWAVAGVGFWLIAGLFSRTGGLYHTLTAVGWGMIPLAVYQALLTPLFLAYRGGISLTASPEFFAYFSNASAAPAMDQARMAQLITHNQQFTEFTTISSILYAAAVLACAYFWFHALMKTRNLDRRQAAITVWVPVLVYLGVALVLRLTSGVY